MSKDAAVEDLSTAVKEGLDLSSKEEKKYDRWTLQDESTIDYGYCAQTDGAGINDLDKDSEKKTFYLTTAINYTNGPAHMGHAYEGATSDAIIRFQRLKGDRPCYFVTGADEHGQKIAATAEKEGKAPQDICDKVRDSDDDQFNKAKLLSPLEFLFPRRPRLLTNKNDFACDCYYRST